MAILVLFTYGSCCAPSDAGNGVSIRHWRDRVKMVEFREYRNDWEYWLNEFTDAAILSWPGTYVAFVSSTSEMFHICRVYCFYDPWF